MTLDRRSLLRLTAGASLARAASAAAAGGGGRHDYRMALALVQRAMELERAAVGAPGMVMALADADGFSATLTAGWADREARVPVRPDHRFQIGSITKSIAALCLFRLAEAGRVSLEARVVDWLPELPLPPEPPVTLGHLLNHSSGLAEDVPAFPRGGDERLWLGFAPGKRFSYSNCGFDLLGKILERIEGESFARIAQRLVLAPLGMDGATARITGADRPLYAQGYAPQVADAPFPERGALAVAPWVEVGAASGCVAATGPAMARYLAYLTRIEAGAPLLGPAWAARFRTPTIEAAEFGTPDQRARYANGLAVLSLDGHDCLHHTGGMIAFSSALTVDPTAGVGGFASVNAGLGDYRPVALTRYACQVLRAVRDRATLPPPPAPVSAALIADAADFAGRYTAAGGETLDLRATGSRLAIMVDGRPAALEAAGSDAFVVRHARFARYLLVFERRDGRVVGAGWGPVAYASGEIPPAATAEPSPAGLTGRYDNDSPWLGTVRVVARSGRLLLDGVRPLVQLPDGSYRVDDPAWSPERVRFEAVLNGRTHRLVLSGNDFVRSSAD